MNEKPPSTALPSYGELEKVWNQDKADAVRGPIIKIAEDVLHAASMRGTLDDPLLVEVGELVRSFSEQFGDTTWTEEQKKSEAQRYRLYHRIIGSTPEGDLFDTEGPNSIGEKMRALAQKYGIRS